MEQKYTVEMNVSREFMDRLDAMCAHLEGQSREEAVRGSLQLAEYILKQTANGATFTMTHNGFTEPITFYSSTPKPPEAE